MSGLYRRDCRDPVGQMSGFMIDLEPVAERCEHGVAVRSMRRGRRSTGDYPPDRPPWSPAHHTEGGNHRIRRYKIVRSEIYEYLDLKEPYCKTIFQEFDSHQDPLNQYRIDLYAICCCRTIFQKMALT